MKTEQEFISSTIKTMGYDDESNTLTITFKSTNKQYEYYNVPEQVWEQAKTAESIGSFFSTVIKGVYPYKGL